MHVAVIGCGKQGSRHAAAFAACAGIDGVTVADLDRGRAEVAAQHLGAACCPTVDAVFAAAAVGAVVIAAPTPSHHALTRRAIAAGKHVLCEKPFGAGAGAARGLAAAVATAGLVGRVGYLYRFAPAIAVAREMVVAGALGRIEAAEIAIAATGGAALWKHRRDTAGGAGNELLSHMIDLARWIFGPIRDCEILEKRLGMPRRIIAGETASADAEDRAVMRLVMESGVAVTLHGDFAAPRFAQSLDIRGDNGTLRASIDPAVAGYGCLARPAAGLAAGRHALPASVEGGLYRRQAQSFLAAIAGDSRGPGCDFAEAAQGRAILDRLRDAPLARA